MNQFPDEAGLSPLPFISFVGLESVKPAHSLIWKTFAIDRAKDRIPVYYKLLPIDHQYPVCKPKKNYSGYCPEGIIKAQWIRKHLLEVPACVLIFQDVDENGIDSPEFVKLCQQNINTVKSHLVGRQTKIVFVLVQASPFSQTQMAGYKESAAKICTECDIDRKCLLVISTEETQISRFVIQIEQVLFELIKSYFMTQIAEVKSHKEQLNKALQISLFVRHEFKIAFFNEFRQLYKEALVFYKNAYVSLMEMKTNSLNIYELKTIASLLNYKICKMSFFANLPMDAFSHFQKHLSISKTNFATSQDYEHQAWLSDQCSIFGALFELAITSKSLEPTVTQYPGLYYNDAVNFSLERRNCAKNVKMYTEAMPNLEELLKNRGQIFIGQFVFQQACTDQDKVNLLLHAHLFRESFVEYPKILIGLYETVLRCIDSYIRNYKKNEKFDKSRFENHIKLCIANEYYQAGHFQEALNYYKMVASFFKKEQWNDIVVSFLPNAIISAIFVANINSYVKLVFDAFALEDINPEFDTFRQKHFNILCKILDFEEHKDLWTLISGNPEVEAKWREIFQKSIGQEVLVQLKNEEFFSLKVAFSKPDYEYGETVQVNTCLASKFSLPQGASLQLRFRNSSYDQFCKHSKIIVDSQRATKNTFQFHPKNDDAKQGQELQIQEAFVILNTRIPVRFSWHFQKEKFEDLFSYLKVSEFHKFKQRSTTKILRIQSKLSVSIDSYGLNEAFVGEKFVYRLKIRSNEKHLISNMKLTLKASLNNETEHSFSAFVYDPQMKQNYVLQEKTSILEQLEPNSEANLNVLVCFQSAGLRFLEFYFSYDLQDTDPETGGMRIVSPELMSSQMLSCIDSLGVSTGLSNIGSEKSSFVRVEEPFKLDIKVVSQHSPIKVLGVETNLCDSIQSLPQSDCSFPAVIEMNAVFATSVKLMPYQVTSSLISIGSGILQWSRKDYSQLTSIPSIYLVNRSLFGLPSTLVYSSDVFLELELPSVCYSRNALLARYRIHNRSDTPILASVFMGNSELFMIAGNKMCKVHIGARESNDQYYTFMPLLCGELQLPKIGVSVEKGGQITDIDYVEQMISSSVFVLPQLRSLN